MSIKVAVSWNTAFRNFDIIKTSKELGTYEEGSDQKKALLMFDENLKSTLKTEKLTTRDSRAVERKKPGRRKARRSFQFSKR